MPEPVYTVYGLRCVCSVDCLIKGVRYVGQTQQATRLRFKNHKREARAGTRTPVYDWMRKHGADKIRLQVLATADSLEELNKQERGAIGSLRKYGSLLNLTDGGEGRTADVTNRRPETAEKIRQTLRTHYGASETHCRNGHVREGNMVPVGRTTTYLRCRLCKNEDAARRRHSSVT